MLGLCSWWHFYYGCMLMVWWHFLLSLILIACAHGHRCGHLGPVLCGHASVPWHSAHMLVMLANSVVESIVVLGTLTSILTCPPLAQQMYMSDHSQHQHYARKKTKHVHKLNARRISTCSLYDELVRRVCIAHSAFKVDMSRTKI